MDIAEQPGLIFDMNLNLRSIEQAAYGFSR